MQNMIISSSRRTDIPAFYSDWFFNRIENGFVMVRNPMNSEQIFQISLDPSVVDCIVFWTKDPAPMIPRLDLLDKFAYYFQFTLNPYDKKIEPGLAEKNKLIKTFLKLAGKIGSDRVIWRYDPIFINDRIDVAFHEKHFAAIAEKLAGSAKKCVISFADRYRKTEKNFELLGIRDMSGEVMIEIAVKLSSIAARYGMSVETCAEEIDLLAFGIGHSRCVDPVLIRKLAGSRISAAKDRNQRDACGCVASVDIGVYDTCPNGCRYCYANSGEEAVRKNFAAYDPKSPILCGKLTIKDTIIQKEAKSQIQIKLNRHP